MTPRQIRTAANFELVAIENPFEKLNRRDCVDWRYYVPLEYRENWGTLSEETRVAIYRMAYKRLQADMADAEWEKNRPRFTFK